MRELVSLSLPIVSAPRGGAIAPEAWGSPASGGCRGCNRLVIFKRTGCNFAHQDASAPMQEKFDRREGVEESLSRPANPPLRFASFVLDLDACTLARESGETIALTRGEFALLRMFVGRPGRVISRDALLDAFANRRFESFDRSVDVLIGKLRRKIEADPKQPRLIVTVTGEGY